MSEQSVPRSLVLSLKNPTVFHGMINDWDILKWKIEDYAALFGGKKLPFRSGTKCCSPEPLWENRCSRENMTIGQFADFVKNSAATDVCEKWLYFDYKYIHEWAPLENKTLNSISWAKFGFPEVDASASTLWMGSRGAHTPCHLDTYGCNLVAQIFGCKQWMLFPPDESGFMEPTRIPYEESSIYSQWNFNCPLPSCFYDKIKKVVIVNLKPGDVLFVPRHWWHYVESLDASVSINTWLPSNLDDTSRMDEALVKFVMTQMSVNVSSEDRETMLNPNEYRVDSSDCCLNLVKTCSEILRECQDQERQEKEPPSKKFKEETSTDSNLLETVTHLVPSSTLQELRSLMDRKCNCSSVDIHQTLMRGNCCRDLGNSTHFLGEVLNAFCHPEVISLVREKLMKSLDIHPNLL